MCNRLMRALSNNCNIWRRNDGMEMVQVAILVAIAVAIGIIFKTQITSFINDVFSKLDSSQF